jgi:YHS domain-containing protein
MPSLSFLPPSSFIPSNSAVKSILSNAVKAAKRVGFGLCVVSALGCSAMQAQNPSEGYGPVNAVPGQSGERLMLKGHDVVNYFVDGKHSQGTAQHMSTYKGVAFHFSSDANKKLFDAAPEKYLPQYGGYCANGVAYAIPWGGDADTWTMVNGKLYIFGGAGSRDAFLLDVPGNIALADKYWKEEIANSNSFFQRAKRMTVKVPHYKSGDELAAMVAKAKATAK